MKKIVSICIVFGMVATLVGCGKNSSLGSSSGYNSYGSSSGSSSGYNSYGSSSGSSGSYSSYGSSSGSSGSYNSSSSSFTNAYGTSTTKCAHSGCNNYIASSGDTNCCTVHSKKCLECGKYIDEDALYCLSCIEKALSSE